MSKFWFWSWLAISCFIAFRRWLKSLQFFYHGCIASPAFDRHTPGTHPQWAQDLGLKQDWATSERYWPLQTPNIPQEPHLWRHSDPVSHATAIFVKLVSFCFLAFFPCFNTHRGQTLHLLQNVSHHQQNHEQELMLLFGFKVFFFTKKMQERLHVTIVKCLLPVCFVFFFCLEVMKEGGVKNKTNVIPLLEKHRYRTFKMMECWEVT